MVVGSTGDEMKGVGEYVSDSGSILSLQPWIFRKGGYQVDREYIASNGDFLGVSVFGLDNSSSSTQVLSPRSVRLGCGFGKRRNSIRSRQNRYSALPMDSQNCLIPQLYGENFEIEEFVFSPVSPPSLPSRRPFYVTDGSHVISKSSYEQVGPVGGNEPSKKSIGVNLRGTIVGFSGLPKSRKAKRKSPLIHQEMEDSANQKQVFGGLFGTSYGLRLFCMGISLGSVVAMLIRKKEVENLNEMLRCSKNLVQDLQDELELKDSLTVREIVSDSCERQVLAHESENFKEGLGLFHDTELNSIHHDAAVNCPSSSDNNLKQSESFSMIEAELQAELERLELSMNVHTLDEQLPAFDEFEDEQIAELVEGELSIDKLNHRDDDHDNSHCNSRGISTVRTPPPNYSVSPTELSLRLHELKQSRLEQRIRELEVALTHSQRHLHFVESEMMESLNASSDMGSSANQGSPTVAEPATATVGQPLCINLSGDALDAYNEAYDEFVRMGEAEEKPPSSAQTSGKLSGDDFCDDDSGLPLWALDGYALSSLASGGHLPEKGGVLESTVEWESELGIDDADGGENDDIDDEEGRNLIEQIVERTRKGSPFVLSVQKMLLSMDK